MKKAPDPEYYIDIILYRGHGYRVKEQLPAFGICVNGKLQGVRWWVEERHWFLFPFIRFWSKTTNIPFDTEAAALQHLTDLCQECTIEYRHQWHKENNV